MYEHSKLIEIIQTSSVDMIEVRLKPFSTYTVNTLENTMLSSVEGFN